MAERLRASRLWLLPFLRPRSYSPILFTLPRGITATTTPRPYSTKGRAQKRPKQLSPRALQRAEARHIESNMSILLPGTLVSPPIWRYPKQPDKFVKMLWVVFRSYTQTLWSTLTMKILSQPTILLSRPRFKFHKSAAVPTAKALHVRMSEAIAAADKEILRGICTSELYQTLAATIDSRPRGTRTEWQLIHYDQKWRYPRIADWRVGYKPLQNGDMQLVKQAIVSISSVQRIARYDDTKGGIKIAGSDRSRRMVEHLVLQANMDKLTYESDPWKIWGTLPEMNYEEIIANIENERALAIQAGGGT
ncbi:uncharacterized protein F4822DRAFT_120114 [Hypoxylon trugodes]|uniref:uncharacterized protein n=1 Tax=Hypoxylon trugodes TaxID=326681 RepID=UPI0021954BDB|nr:uncharacterized protein F4822DRAFT_120114 [Hypoxylon trugodes]KAI1392218.1 hypothetical protein F4822DRAFT_120114 [Hypoxylon trugodes]